MNNILDLEQRKDLIGKRIRYERKTLGLSQERFSEELDRERALIGRWERGERLPSLEDLINMCELFNCEVGYLLCEEGYENKTRKVTDICNSTGLSEESVNLLIEDKKTMDKINAWVKKRTKFERKSKSISLDIIERIIKNDKYILTEIDELRRIKSNIKQIEKDIDYPIIEQAFNIATTAKVSIEYADSGAYESAEKKDIFLNTLESLAEEKYSAEERLSELYSLIENGSVIMSDDAVKATEERILNSQPWKDTAKANWYQTYETLIKRSNIEKYELAIGLKFQKIVNDSIESILAGLEDK